jgi:hypothetical protein
MIRRVGHTVVFALAKPLNKGWTHKDVETASSPENLSRPPMISLMQCRTLAEPWEKHFLQNAKTEIPSSVSALQEARNCS